VSVRTTITAERSMGASPGDTAALPIDVLAHGLRELAEQAQAAGVAVDWNTLVITTDTITEQRIIDPEPIARAVHFEFEVKAAFA
jgi:hypothetical protein